MYIFNRIWILLKFIFLKKVDIVINGVNIRLSDGDLEITSDIFMQNYMFGYINCSPSFIVEQENSESGVEVEAPTCSNTCVKV
jgi:hypothetical protein